jgi:hypothetical protein
VDRTEFTFFSAWWRSSQGQVSCVKRPAQFLRLPLRDSCAVASHGLLKFPIYWLAGGRFSLAVWNEPARLWSSARPDVFFALTCPVQFWEKEIGDRGDRRAPASRACSKAAW